MLDAGVLISHLDARDAHHVDSVWALAELADAGERLAASALTISEALVRPANESEAAMQAAFYVLTDEVGIEVLDVTEDVGFEISRARAANAALKTPDAAVVATARRARATRILTTDRRLARFDEAVTVREFASGGR